MAFRFEHTEFLWAFLLIPVLMGLFALARYSRNKALKKFGDSPIIQRLIPEYSPIRPFFKAAALIFAFIFLIIALANPQLGAKMKTIKQEGSEIIIALDVSNSMLAEDIKPNRLEKAKLSISQLINRLHNDKLGLIVFAGDAFVQLPITTDYSAAKMFLRSVDTETVPVQGTAIGKAMELSIESFTQENKRNKALIIISDGENHEDDAINFAKQAVEAGIQVHTIGIGSPNGVPIPVYNRFGQKDFRKNRQGEIVVTKLNESMMREIAAAGEGSYVRASNARTGLGLIFDKINQLEKEEFETKSFSDYESWFQVFVFIAICFLLVEFIILPRKNRWLSKVDIFKVKA